MAGSQEDRLSRDWIVGNARFCCMMVRSLHSRDVRKTGDAQTILYDVTDVGEFISSGPAGDLHIGKRIFNKKIRNWK